MPKYYGVRSGRETGVFNSWVECERQVKGYKGALFQSFPTRGQAEDYASGASSGACGLLRPLPGDEGPHYDIFVDGSFDVVMFRYGWAFAAYDGSSRLVHQDYGVGTDPFASQIRNVAGELQAATEAVLWAKQAKAGSVTIHHDYIGISEWALGRWKANNPITQDYARFMLDYLHWVGFNKVPAHSGVAGNELVDRLAKRALRNIG